jgi:phosphoribosylamine--glycine ligase
VTIVLASRGYPDKPEKGAEITLPEEVPEGVIVFHAGTIRDEDGTLRVSGGRVLNVTAVGANWADALAHGQATAKAIRFEGKIFRTDIGWREARRGRVTAPWRVPQ